MNIKKIYNYKSDQQIWRLLIAGADRLVIETRDVDSKEVFFNCIEIETGKSRFKDLQFEEKFWIGIEVVYKDVVFFHKYAKPDMPGHKEIICFDIETQKILWTQDKLSFLFVYNDQVIASADTFEGWHFYAFDYKTGRLITDYGENAQIINQLRKSSEEENDYSLYKFPGKITKDTIRLLEGDTVIKDRVLNLDIVGDVEYTYYEDLFLMNYHYRKAGTLINQFTAVDMDRNKIIFDETLNSAAKAFVPDSFFVYKDFLILLKEKNQAIVCRIK